MRLTLCVACGSQDDLQHHHLVPRSEGGLDEESNLITLCGSCHAKLHQRQWDGSYNHAARTRAALQAAKAQGVKLGGLNAQGIQERDEAKARAEALRPILAELVGMSVRGVAAELNRRGIPTPNGGAWHATSVVRVQRRLAGG